MPVGMSQYNRENPFVYLIQSTNDKLVEESEKAIKNVMIMGILEFFVLVFSIITWILLKDPQLGIIILSIGLSIFAFLQIRQGIRATRTTDINLMIYGSEFTYKNVNNEELLSRINNINVNLGRILFAKESIYIFDLIFLSLILIYMVRIMIFIFS